MKTYQQVVDDCKEIYENNSYSYGEAWREIRPSTATDLLYIKAKRVRTILDALEQKVEDSVESELMGIVNYCIIAHQLVRCNMSYDEVITETHQLMLDKDHDYGSAWKDIRLSSIVDIIAMKIRRIKHLEGLSGLPTSRESHYKDIINWAIFAIIKYVGD